jgi:hypothetical protein
VGQVDGSQREPGNGAIADAGHLWAHWFVPEPTSVSALPGTRDPLASYDTSHTSNSILTSFLALTPAFPGGLIPKSVCFTVAAPV